MSPAEVAEFARSPDLEQIVRVRYLDDAGKVPGMATPGLAHYVPMLQRMIDRHCRVAGD